MVVTFRRRLVVLDTVKDGKCELKRCHSEVRTSCLSKCETRLSCAGTSKSNISAVERKFSSKSQVNTLSFSLCFLVTYQILER